MQKTAVAVRVLSALAQKTRLEAFRLLLQHEPIGLPATMIAERLKVAGNTMSLHLNVLVKASLVGRKREGKYIIYRANVDALAELMLFLAKDCCAAAPELRKPLLAQIARYMECR